MVLQRGSVARGVQVHTEYPFGKSSIRSDGVQYSSTAIDDATGSTAAWVDVQSITVEPPGGGGTIVELELGITWSQRNSSTGSFVNGRIVGRNKSGTWVALLNTATNSTSTTGTDYQQSAADATTYQNYTYSGRVPTTANLDTVPFDLAVQIQREGTTGTATGKVRNSSYVTVKYR